MPGAGAVPGTPGADLWTPGNSCRRDCRPGSICRRFPEDDTAYVLSDRAVKAGWVPPEGFSALPKAVRASDQTPAFAIADINVTSPNGAETWESGSLQAITWTSAGLTDVRIRLSRDGGTTWGDIVSSTAAAAGSYSWTVTGPESPNCVVRVSDAADGSPVDQSDATFAIVGITVTSPNGGETWYYDGPDQVISWTSGGVAGNVDIDYTVDGGANWTPLATDTVDTGSLTWVIPDRNSANCLVRVQETGGGGLSDVSDAVFAIAPAAVTVTAPTGGETWDAGSSQAVTWTSVGVASVKVELSRDGGTTWEGVVALTDAAAGAYSWTVTGPASGDCLARVSDAADGSPLDESDAAFTIREQITVTLSPSAALEGDGTLSIGTVTVPTPVTSPVTVTLSPDDTSEVTVPSQVTIQTGQTSVDFDVTIVNDTEIDGDQTVTITASATAYFAGNDSMVVNDSETQTITVTLPASATEGDGVLVGQGQVSIPGTWTTNLVIDLDSDDTTELTVPATATIPQGDTSATFNLTVIDDGEIDGAQAVTVTPSLTGWTGTADSIDILDDESQTITVTLPASATEGDRTLPGQGSVTIPGVCETDLVVDLSSSDTTEVTVLATVTVLQGDTSATFDLTIVGDGIHRETQTVTVTASAAGWTSGSADMDVIYKAITPFDRGCAPGAGGAAGLALCVFAGYLALRPRRRTGPAVVRRG